MTDSVFNTGGPQPKKQNRNQNSSTQSQCVRSQATIYPPWTNQNATSEYAISALLLSYQIYCIVSYGSFQSTRLGTLSHSLMFGVRMPHQRQSLWMGSHFQSGQTWLLVFDDFVRDSQDVPISEQEISLVRYQYGRTQSA